MFDTRMRTGFLEGMNLLGHLPIGRHNVSHQYAVGFVGRELPAGALALHDEHRVVGHEQLVLVAPQVEQDL